LYEFLKDIDTFKFMISDGNLSDLKSIMTAQSIWSDILDFLKDFFPTKIRDFKL